VQKPDLLYRLSRSISLFLALCGISGSAPPPSSLAREMVEAHNAVRARVRVPPLKWSDRLAKVSQDWANTLLTRGQIGHRPDSQYGENVFAVSGAEASPRQVVDSWAAESRDYDHGRNKCRGVCGHYTQIVWRDTKEVGCAAARRGSREVWVCNYSPAGNWMGEWPY